MSQQWCGAWVTRDNVKLKETKNEMWNTNIHFKILQQGDVN